MKILAFSDKAREELRDIYAYTEDRWGAAQAEAYLGHFDKAFARLADGSAVSRPADLIKPGLRKLQVRRHMVFFRETEGRVEVVRVLHERMDVGRV